MRKLIKNIIATLICFSGIPLLIRECISKNRVAILMYHDVSADVFERHIAYLSRHYSIIPLDSLVTAICQQDFSQIPMKSVVITIDDGYAGNFTLLPIVKRYNIRPTIYVCTQIINTHRHFWFKVAGQTKSERERLKRVDNTKRLEHLKQHADFEQERTYPERQALNINEIKEMSEVVHFQPHTQFHPILTHCSESECKQEILGSKIDLENLLGSECIHFSYPNGDYTEREERIVREGGFRSARTTKIGWNTNRTPVYQLMVIPIADDAGNFLFRAQLTTIPQRINKLFRTIFLRRKSTIRKY